MTATPEASHRTLRRALATTRRVVRRHGLWHPGDHLLLACSGGLDSMTAMALLDELRPSLGHELSVGHVAHGLRVEAAADGELVVQVATQRGLPVRTVQLAVAAGADLQGRARTARYAALATLAASLGCNRIVTAHHGDDQAETLLMHLVRGAGPDAIAGIRRFRDDGVVRPFLELDRATLRTCAATLGLRWREDPTNDDRHHLRNRVRHEALPALSATTTGAAAGLARSAANLEGLGGAIDHWIAVALAGSSFRQDGATVEVPLALVPADFFALSALLAFVARRLGCPVPSRRASEQVHAALAICQPTVCRLHGIDVQIGSERVDFTRTDVARPGAPD